MDKDGRKLFATVALALLAAPAALLAFSAWSIAPFSTSTYNILKTAIFILQAPKAERMVIGDSRVEFATPPRGVFFVGYGGGSSRQLERVSGVLCALGNAKVTIALGINDTKPTERNMPVSQAALEGIVDACDREDLWISAIWPAEAGVEPAGDDYDPGMTAALDAYIGELARRKGLGLIEVPPLQPGYTYDGVHFIDSVSREYARELAFPEVEKGGG
ncbi:MAG: SGNH/GDSL hydrolase family protein [Erythrobacter sp.]